MSHNSVLIFVHIATHFKEMIRVARLMKNSTAYKPIIFFDAKYKGIENDLKLCDQERIAYTIGFPTKENVYCAKDAQFRTFFEKMNQNIKKQLHNLRIYFKELVQKINTLINRIIWKLVKQILSLVKALAWLIIFSSKLIPKQFFQKLILNSYKLMWNKFPGVFPPISRAAHGYYEDLPEYIKKQNIKLMAFPEHNLFYFTQLFVHVGRQYHVPSFIVPFTIVNTLEWSQAFYNDHPRDVKYSVYNQIFALFFPDWIHKFKDRELCMPLEIILIHEMLKIRPKKTWLINSGDIDFLAVEGKAMKNYYLSAGIEEKILKVTGALYHDDLYVQLQDAEKNRKELFKSLGLQGNKPMILCALAPDQFQSREGFIDFENYESFVRFLIKELSIYADNYHIIINLHPRIELETVAFIHEYPVKISKKDITALLPLCSIYIATCSATIRMAISAGIPVLNFDVYRYNYDDYTGLKAVLTMTERSEFVSALNKLATSKDYYEAIKNEQIKQSEQWGKPDGTAGKNLLREITRLCEQSCAIQ